jgi:hypothetical protein
MIFLMNKVNLKIRERGKLTANRYLQSPSPNSLAEQEGDYREKFYQLIPTLYF